MDDREVAEYNCFNSICSFGDAHTNLFPTAGFAGGFFTRMKGVVTRLEDLGANKVSATGASRQSTASKSEVKRRLSATLEGLNLAADAMGLDTPGFERKFRRPREKSNQALLNAARAFHEDALALEADFINYGMGAGFLAELAAEIADFERATGEHQNHAQTGVAVTAGVDDVIEEGRSIRRHLNAIVTNTLRDDHALLAAWESASHIERPSRKPKAKPPTPSTSPSAEAPGTSAEPTA